VKLSPKMYLVSVQSSPDLDCQIRFAVIPITMPTVRQIACNMKARIRRRRVRAFSDRQRWQTGREPSSDSRNRKLLDSSSLSMTMRGTLAQWGLIFCVFGYRIILSLGQVYDTNNAIVDNDDLTELEFARESSDPRQRILQAIATVLV
jgi:hypothetical protein